jgi:hypothetical protein
LRTGPALSTVCSRSGLVISAMKFATGRVCM